MLKRERLVLCAFLPVALFVLAACGAPATPGPTFAPTLVYPTRIPIVYPTSKTAGTQPAAVAVLPSATATIAPTLALPTSTATITLIPASPTSLPATATQAVTATVAQPAAASGGAGGDPAAGKALFVNGFGDPAVPACGTCHNVDTADVKVGPSQLGIASRAGTRVPGQDAATYIHNSIINPNAFIVPNDGAHIYSLNGTSLMYQDYAKHLSDKQINDLVAYLLTLK